MCGRAYSRRPLCQPAPGPVRPPWSLRRPPPLPSAEKFQQFARTIGINRDSLVVVYDDQRLAFAARAWFLLHYFGHDRIAVLNGGLGAWVQAGLPLENGDSLTPARGDFIATPGRRYCSITSRCTATWKTRPGS
ncbi:sulfurtransferase [Microbulbifer taiwanensis]|uniref:sulfurtransferase n=1 Tax=Microbulbifer taiwanensis TaxID=986746 RepID=UPI003616D576